MPGAEERSQGISRGGANNVYNHIFRFTTRLKFDGPVGNTGGHNEIGPIPPLIAIGFIVSADPLLHEPGEGNNLAAVGMA